MNKTLKFPTPDEIQNSLEKVEKLLEIKQLNMNKNFAVKEGLTDCVRILKSRLENPKNDFFIPHNEKEIEKRDKIYREQLKGIEKLQTVDGRSMAVLCVDYLNGLAKSDIFDNFEKSIIWR